MKLSEKELSVMKVLWEYATPLTTGEIVEYCVDKTWKETTIHMLINNLLDKGAIKVVGMAKTARTYSRTFAPTISRSEYFIDSFNDGKALDDISIRAMASSLIHNKNISKETLDILSEQIRREKEKHN